MKLTTKFLQQPQSYDLGEAGTLKIAKKTCVAQKSGACIEYQQANFDRTLIVEALIIQ